MANLSYRRQSAVIAIKDERVCMVTSSDGKRWTLPKGGIDPGHTAGQAALQEAYEEAGLDGILISQPLGSFAYDKNGQRNLVFVFVMRVNKIHEDWPERRFRQRAWLEPGEVLQRIDDAGLRDIFRYAVELYMRQEREAAAV